MYLIHSPVNNFDFHSHPDRSNVQEPAGDRGSWANFAGPDRPGQRTGVFLGM